MIEHYTHFLPKLMHVTAVTFGRHVYYAISKESITHRLRKHEMVHVNQYNQLGFIRFLYRYLNEYVGFRLKGMNHNQAYLEISFEKEARQKETLND
jgi:hypothetical protein